MILVVNLDALATPEVAMAVGPDSTASGQPSPSESKSL